MFSHRWCIALAFCWVFGAALHARGVLRVCVTDTLGQSLPGVVAVLEGGGSLSFLTDSSGCFSVALPVPKTYRLVLSGLSYHSIDTLVMLNGDCSLAFQMVPLQQQVDEVIISASKHVDSRHIVLGAQDFATRGRGMGERDIVAILQQHAGVAHSSEVNPGLYVRGLDNGYTGIFYAGCELPGVQHMLSIYPQFNSDAIGQVRLIKGDFSPRYGGYLASYLMVEPDRHRPDRFNGSVETGLLTTKISLQMPFSQRVWTKMSFRRSYFDIVANGYNRSRSQEQDQLPLYGFYDFSNTLMWDAGDKGVLAVDLFLSGDNIRFTDQQMDFDAHWNNALMAGHWHRALSAVTRLDVNGGYTRFHLDADFSNLLGREVTNRVEQSNLTASLTYDGSSGIVMEGGIDIKSNRIDMAGNMTSIQEENIMPLTWGNRTFNFAGFGQLQWAMGASWLVKAGLRGEIYHTDSTFLHLLPYGTLSGHWRKYAIHAAYSRQVQYKHLFVPTGINLPLNIWYPATAALHPEKADHFNVGADRSLAKGVEISMSVFYIRLLNATEFIDGNYFTSLEFVAEKGKGDSGGVEAAVNYQSEIIEAGISYTCSYSRRRFDSINNGEWFSPSYDVPHKVDFNMVVRPFKQWTITVSQFFQSGQMATLPTSIYLHQKADGGGEAAVQIVPVYTSRYNYRMPWAHRMDVSAAVELPGKKIRSVLTFGAYNVYNYQNPYFIYYEPQKQADLRSFLQSKKKSLLPFVPFVNYRLEF